MTSKADDDVIDNTSLESLPIVHLGSCCCATKSTSSSTEEGMEAYDEGQLPAKRSGDRKRIGILGTGDYARAMSKRLLFSGYDVILGSRSPAARQRALYDNCLCGVQMMSLDDCISQCDVLVAAIHMENFKTTLAPRAEILSDKIVIDVSNRTNRYSAVSNAEFLQSLIPASVVVKAFNSVSAYAMEDQTTVRNNRVFVCSNDPTAIERVMDLARDLGFGPCDMGGLKAARNLEASILKVFPGWKIPLLFAFGVFNLWAVYCAFMYFVERTAYRWDQIFLKVLNKPLSMTAITVLTLTYLPGSVAGIVQLYRGTKYRRFPRWLNAWLVSRRQLGLIALALVMVHALASAMMLSPTYYSSWYHQPSVVIPANVTEQMTIKLQPAWMVWKGELACLFGLAALLLLSLVGVASLPSVSASLNWAEWRLIQSIIGIMALFLAVAHVVAMGAPGWAKGGWTKTFRSITFLSGFLPAVTVLLRMILALPPLSLRLKKIRRGWERDSAKPQTLSTAASLESKVCRSSRKMNLETSSSRPGFPVYTAVNVNADGEECCGSCQNSGAETVLPTRDCACYDV
ncbi:metalloreductase STEAP4-like [Littorina saxatilis]|uniref:Pyrroline-5-carboxylate reductase catalytic N-terminal domain-containing protein n=1 Tax=Littorina saxatilis TaxID=31220 RepID=A0AAN9AP81_9CAEN